MEPGDVSTKQRRIAELARRHPELSFTSLAHHIDLNWLREAYERTRKDGAVGVDGQTAEDYAQELSGNLTGLLERMKAGTYFAPPVRRTHIPKGTGKELRPIGIPTFEDKVLQRAAVMALEPLYEADFLDCSYGFRPGRSAHGALEALWKGLTAMGGGWVIDLDISKFFDTLEHGKLREILKSRMRDGVLTRLIGKWLNAGVMEERVVSYPGQGTPQGGVISPLLSNIYLHTVLDKWFEGEVIPRLKGKAFEIRYADDAVLVFELKEDAERVMAVLPKRFEKYGLKIHPVKTRLVRFEKPDNRRGSKSGPPTWEKFNFLGFTHYWGRGRNGAPTIMRKTEASRFTRAIKQVAEWCRGNRHLPVQEQHAILSAKLMGHCAYYGITGNYRSLENFLYVMTRTWRKWLSRRQRGNPMPWDRFNRLLDRYPLPTVRIVHSYLAAKP